MSTGDVNCENKVSTKTSKKKLDSSKKDINDGVEHGSKSKKKICDETMEQITNKQMIKCSDIEDDVISPPVKENELLFVYDKETLLDLRSAPGSLQKPDCLSEEFFNRDGVWDPEAWHKSNSSRSASPAIVDGKTVVVEGKKIELVGDDIQLAPHRGSFRQGCHVQPGPEKSERLAPRIFEKKNRLTGRASSQRRDLENNYDKEEKPRFDKYPKENDAYSKDTDRFYDRTERFDKNDYRRKNGSFPNEKPGKLKNEKSYHSKRNYDHEENLPEWMTDGPTSQHDIMEFTGFQEIEDEKKAFANAKRKKKVRISPNVETQIIKEYEEPEKTSKSKITTTKDANDKEPSKFDLNEFFNEVDYYPPHMFQKDKVVGDGVKSRFTQWFQAKQQHSRSNSVNSNGSKPESTSNLIPDEVFTGVSRKSPVAPTPYFTPIQPAPALITAAANAHAVQTSNIMNIIKQRRKSQEEKTNVEIKGRLSLKDLENENVGKVESIATAVQVESDSNRSAFDMLIMHMKEAGQLPDKPAPVVTGLPEHLLPQPPKRTSPTFEKLKQSLSRSPSPAQLRSAVSTLAEVISSNPSLQKDIDQRKVVPSPVNQSVTPVGIQNPSFFEQRNNIVKDIKLQAVPADESVIENSSQSKRLPRNAFTPTSVLKKLHNEKQRESPVPLSHSDGSFIEKMKAIGFPDLTSETRNMEKISVSEIERIATTPDRSHGTMLPFHSAPTTPRNHLNLAVGAPPHSASVPTTPDHSFRNDPPSLHRLTIQPGGSPTSRSSAFTPTKTTALMAPSAFQRQPISALGVIGSGIPQRSNHDDTRFLSNFNNARGLADPRLAPGNGATRNARPFNFTALNESGLAPGSRPVMQSTPMPSQQHMHQSQQQQLLQAQRMAQIQQAQLHQQQKLHQIANQANQQKLLQQKQQQGIPGKPFQIASAIGPLLPDPEAVGGQQLRTPAEQRLQQQQQQRQQIQAYQQQHQNLQHQQQPQQGRPNVPNTNFRGGRPFPPSLNARNSPPIPMPIQQPNLPIHPLNPRPQNIPNLAAQALVQQQLLTRARFLAQAQLLQQQPQVFQAALMAQAALARGQAQAQAAMMLNPRNIQAMAEQMGIRPPQNKAIPTPMVSSHNQTPLHRTDLSPDNALSKWFTHDQLQKLPQNKGPTEVPGGKVFSVEELEQHGRST